MFRKFASERGQALIIITFAMIGLIGITGLAIDGGMAFSDRRHAQNAADAASLAGALAKLRTPEGDDFRPAMQSVARDRAGENGYTGDLINSEVYVYTCEEASASCEYPYAGDPDYVQVIIVSHINTWFARAIGIPQVHNRVQAVALADNDDSGPLYNGENIIALSHECQSPDNFIVEGNPDIALTGGGLYINTDDPACGFKCDTSAGSITGDITTAGGTFDASASCTEGIVGTVDEGGGELFDFPVYLKDLGLDIPPECDGPQGTYTNYPAGYYPGFDYPGFPTEPVTVLTPGYYGKFPPDKEQPLGKLKDRIILLPGTYCVGEVLRWNQPTFFLLGQDVTLFIRSGYSFSLTGGVIDIDAPDSGPYAGYLIIVEPDYSAAPENCTINGDANNEFTGTILAPYCNITINGGSSPTGFNSQIIGYTIDLSGNSTINFNYDPGENGTKIDPPKIGMTR